MSDYFELLSIERKYDIDLKKLDQQYIAMQIKHHPDRSIDKVQKQQNLSISIDINKAYNTLKDDAKRAEYILSLNGLKLDDPSIRTNISALELQNIWNELEILENTQDLIILENLYNQKTIEKNKLITDLKRVFEQNKLQDALDTTIKLKYLNNLIDNIQLNIKNFKQ